MSSFSLIAYTQADTHAHTHTCKHTYTQACMCLRTSCWFCLLLQSYIHDIRADHVVLDNQWLLLSMGKTNSPSLNSHQWSLVHCLDNKTCMRLSSLKSNQPICCCHCLGLVEVAVSRNHECSFTVTTRRQSHRDFIFLWLLPSFCPSSAVFPEQFCCRCNY